MLSEHGKSKIGYLSALVKPLAKIVMLTALFTLIGRRIGIGDNTVLFITTGVITFSLSVEIAHKLLRVNKAPQKMIRCTPATSFDFSLAFLLSEAIVLIVAACIILVALGNFDYWDHRVDSLLGILLMALLAIALGYGVGLINLSIAAIIPAYEAVWKVIKMPLLLISGVVFVADQRFPPEVLAILLYNPLLHIIEAMRSYFYRSWDSAIVDLNYVFWFTLTVLFIGFVLQKLTQNKERP